MITIIKYIDIAFIVLVLSILVVLFIQIKKNGDKSGNPNNSVREGFFSRWFGPKGSGLILAFIIIFGGWVIGREASRTQESFMKQALINNLKDLSGLFQSEDTTPITFTQEDENSVHFNRVANLLNHYSKLTGVHHIYTLQKRGRHYYFGPMNHQSDDPYYFSPGSKYPTDRDILDSVVLSRTIYFAGRHNDGFGQNVSCYLPLLDKSNDKVLLVIGMSVSAEMWERNLFLVRIIPFCLTLCLLIIVLIYVRSSLRRKKGLQRVFYQRVFYFREGILLFISGLLITLYVTHFSYQKSLRYHQIVFSQSAHGRGSVISQTINKVRYSVSGLARLFEVSEEVTENEFADYVQDLVNYPFVEAVGWARQLSESDDNFVIEYQVPETVQFSENRKLILREDTLRRNAVLEALKSGYISVTNTCVDHGKKWVELFLRTRDKNRQTNGFVIVSLDLTQLLESISRVNTEDDPYFEISLLQIDHLEAPRQDCNNLLLPAVFGKRNELSYEYYDFFFGKVYNISIVPLSGYYEIYGDTVFVSVLILGILVSLVISVIIVVLVNRRYLLEKQIEKYSSRLKESQDRFLTLFSAMREGVAFHEIILDDEGNPKNYIIKDVNSAFEILTTIPYKKVIGADTKKIFGKAYYLEQFSQVVKEKKSVIFDGYFEPANKYFRISAAPWGENGFAAIFYDITKQVIVEKKLKKSEERYRLISENAGDLITIFNHNTGKLSYISPSVKKISGYSYNEVVGKGLEEVVSKKSYEKIMSAMPERIVRFEKGDDSERVKSVFLEIRHRGGGTVPVEVVTTLLTDKNNKVTSILGVGRDIRERLKAEDSLRKSEEKFRLLVENQNDLVVKVDKHGRFLYVSPSYCRLFGRTKEELQNRKYIPMVHPDDRKATQEALKKLLKPPYQVTIEQRAMTRDGWRWLSWSDTAVFDKSGEIKEIIGIGRDITERKVAEKALQKSRELLERQNKEYAALNEEYMAMNEELSKINDELSVAIEKAEESEKLKTAFLQNMSHEIRTPLNAIIGFSEMLGMDYLTDDDRKEFTSIIVNSGRQLLELVNDILTISAIETHQDKLNLSLLNLNLLLRELHSVFSPKTKAKGLELKVELGLPDDGCDIRSDELKLRQIFINLLGNALKFTSEGEIEFGYKKEDSGEILCYVRDSGVGISKDNQGKIFERFVQADSTIKPKYGGTGLGLSICKGHVEMLGGKIWLESTPGVGSVFYFTHPG
ncbi:PAS domain S-box protein [Thermophagus sp. OGC60D27]|uniref:PAS domain S-box protein n=1 Tax=Thermophagus sp. OGC60D27 TaxID=3458415 RepID=UPI004037ED7D